MYIYYTHLIVIYRGLRYVLSKTGRDIITISNTSYNNKHVAQKR